MEIDIGILFAALSQKKEFLMLGWILIFFITALIAAVFGFTGIHLSRSVHHLLDHQADKGLKRQRQNLFNEENDYLGIEKSIPV